MRELMVIAFGAGLQDSLNPCIFMTSAVFMAYGLWLKKNSLRILWLYIIFSLVYAVFFTEFNFGIAQILVFRKDFIFAAKIFYFILGAGALVLGIKFFKDWFLMRLGPPASPATDEKIKSWIQFPRWRLLTMVILAVVLSATSTLSPINNYIMVLCNGAFINGLWHSVLPLLLTYIATVMWPLWFVGVFLSMKNLQPSLLKIVCSSIFFTASSSMLFILKI